MDRSLRFSLLLATVFASFLCVSPASLAQEPTGGARAAIVEDADLVGYLDLAGVRRSPIIQRFEKETESLSEEAAKNRDLWRRLTGLEEHDYLSLWFSVDFGEVTLETVNTSPAFDQVEAVMAIQLASSLDQDTLRRAVEHGLKDKKGASFSDTMIGDTAVLVIPSDAPDKPDILSALSRDGKTVFFTFRPQSLEDALARAATETYAALPQELVPNADEARHARIAFLAPDALRDAIASQLQAAESNPEAAMTSGFLAPFGGLKMLSLEMNFSEEFELELVSQLGSEADVNQALGMFQMMLPMLKASLAEKSGREPGSYNDMISFGSAGSELSLRFRFTEEELRHFQEQQNKKKQTAEKQ